MINNLIESEDDALIYIGDTMCSWCYGFEKELSKLVANHPELDFHLVMGGLRPYNTEKAIDLADFLKSHWIKINQRTGQEFKFDILSDPDFVYDTEPALRAVIVARMMNPEIEFEFFKDVQTSFYRDNNNTNTIEMYLKIAELHGLNLAEYSQLFESEEAKNSTKLDFQLSKKLGIKGFPSMVLRTKGKYVLISNGYRTAEAVEETIKLALG